MNKNLYSSILMCIILSANISGKARKYLGFSFNPSRNKFNLTPSSVSDSLSSSVTRTFTIKEAGEDVTEDEIRKLDHTGYMPYGKKENFELSNIDIYFGTEIGLRNKRAIFFEAKIGWGAVTEEFIGGRDGILRRYTPTIDEDKNLTGYTPYDVSFAKSLTVSKGLNFKLGGGILFSRHGNVFPFVAGHIVAERLIFYNNSANTSYNPSPKIKSNFDFSFLVEGGTRIFLTRSIHANISLFYNFRMDKKIPEKLTVFSEVNLQNATVAGGDAIAVYPSSSTKNTVSADYSYNTLGVRLAINLYI